MEKCEQYKLVTKKWSEGETERLDKVRGGFQWSGEGLRVAAQCGAAVCVSADRRRASCARGLSLAGALILYDNGVA
jgi:hypothetical protein